jgi:23S rRNA-/tRNA-specific pseudouridylate synthase
MYSGFPILGDPQYNSPESAALSAEMGLEYQLLCAKMLELEHPITGEKLVIHSHMDV